MFTARILLLGSGELGKEFVISAKRYGCHVVACDSYANAPAMQVADEAEVFSMLDPDALRAAIEKHKPDFIVPEIEAIRTEVLHEFEDKGFTVVPSARAASLTMNRDRIRELAANRTRPAHLQISLCGKPGGGEGGAEHTGLPCVIKPVMSSSGKGQSTVRTAGELEQAWDDAVANMRGDRKQVIVEEFIAFEYEITLLTIRSREGVSFCEPIGHRQERGDYQESWQPTPMTEKLLDDAKDMARKVVDDLGGYGIFGVEFFVTRDEVIFSELSPASARYRPGHAPVPEPVRVRSPRPRGPRPADPAGPAAWPDRLRRDSGRPRGRALHHRRPEGGACPGFRGGRRRGAHFRQADDPQAPAHGRSVGFGRHGRRSARAGPAGSVQDAHHIRGLIAQPSAIRRLSKRCLGTKRVSPVTGRDVSGASYGARPKAA